MILLIVCKIYIFYFNFGYVYEENKNIVDC